MSARPVVTETNKHYPIGLVTFCHIQEDTDDNWYSNASDDRMLNITSTPTIDNCAFMDAFGLVSWTVNTNANSAAYALSNLLMTNTALNTATQNAVFRYLNNLTPNERGALTKVAIRSRLSDKALIYNIGSTAFAATYVMSWLWKDLHSRVRAWLGQTDCTENPKLIVYDENIPETWLPGLYQDTYGAISGDDLHLIREVMDSIIDQRVFIPEEAMIMGDKDIGYIDLPVPESFAGVQYKSQQLHVHIVDGDAWSSGSITPKVANLTTLLTLMKNIGTFFAMLSNVVIYPFYNRNDADVENFKKFLDAYKCREIVYSDLVAWNKCECPWWIYQLRTHYDGVSTRFEFLTYNYSTDYLMTGNLLHRLHPDYANDKSKYLQFRQIPGFTVEQCLEMIYIGYIQRIATMSSNPETPDIDLSEENEMDYDDGDMMTLMLVYEQLNADGTLRRAYAGGALIGSSFVIDTYYSPFIWANDDNDTIDNLFKLTCTTLPSPDATARAITITDSGTTLSVVVKIHEFNKLYPIIFIDADQITFYTFKPGIFNFFNPILVKEADKPKYERKSKLTHDTYSKSTDSAELNLYIEDLIAEAKTAEGQQKDALEKTIGRVKEQLEKLKAQDLPDSTSSQPVTPAGEIGVPPSGPRT